MGMGSLPLRYRLPNPPAVFIGRAAETVSFNEAVRRSPLVVVTGPNGVGKTAFVLHALHRKKRGPRTIYIDVRHSTGEELRLEVLGAVAEAEGIDSMNRAALRGDADTVMAELLDLAERGPWWFVLDNLHHIDAAESRALLQALARYARKSRWVAISSMDPQVDDDAAQVVSLSGMQPVDLERMATAWGTDDAARVGRAVAVSGGSPWLLRQCLVNGRDVARVTREGLLEGLTREQVELVDALSVLDVPLPLEVLASFCPPSLDADVAALEPRGILERTPAGVRLHEVASSVLAASEGSGGRARWRNRAAVGLSASNDPVGALEGLRLLMTLGRLGDVVDHLDRRGSRYLDQGYAPALWRVLSSMTDPRLEGWRLRCATELGSPTALRMVLEPSLDNLQDRVTWAQTLFMQGRLDDADRTARAVLQSVTPETPQSVAFEAGLVLANCTAARGDVHGAVARLTGLAELSPPDAARRDAAIAIYLAGTPDARRANAIANALANSVDALPMAAREEVAYGIAYVRRRQGRLADAAAMLRAATATPRGGVLKHLVARRALWLGAAIALDRGQLEETEQRLAKLAPFVRTASVFRPSILSTTIGFRLARGDLEWLGNTAADVEREASAFGIVDVAFLARAQGVQLASLRSLELTRSTLPRERSPGADRLFIRLLEHRVLRAGPITTEESERLDAIDAPGLRPLARAVRARAALVVDGDVSKALAEVTSAVSDAAASGHLVVEAEARLAHCDILLVLGRTAELSRVAEELSLVAQRLGSRRFEFEASFATAVAAEGLDFAVLEHLAAQFDTAPVAARRSRLLLGAGAPTDHFDQSMLAAIAGRPAHRVPSRVDGPEGQLPEWDGPAWGIDEATRRVWLPDARWVEFGRRALHWDLLLCLADAGGAATKEHLVHGVWKECEYHPLKHDARLQVAVRKVRELIEENPSAPERVVTTDDGYAFAGIVRRARSAD